MTDRDWAPEMPLRADATNDQILDRYNHGPRIGDACKVVQVARELAHAEATAGRHERTMRQANVSRTERHNLECATTGQRSYRRTP